jgi:ferric iron reductase protein FhuF
MEEKKDEMTLAENDFNNQSSSQDRLEGLLKECLAKNEEILQSIGAIRRYIRWQKTWSLIRFLIIAIPIILSIIYLPPLIKDAMQSYQSFKAIW